MKYCSKGIDVVIVNPTRVFGPGKLTPGNSVTKIISWYIQGLWRFLPVDGGSIGNYVYINDIIDGLILAAGSGRNGERYILGGENLAFAELFDRIGEAAGRKRKMVHIPAEALKIISDIMKGVSVISGKSPVITREWINKYLDNSPASSVKAINQLSYKITPFSKGAEETIRWLISEYK